MSEIKTVTVSYDYSAGGWPASPTYTGSRSFGMNIFEDAHDDDIAEIAHQRVYQDCKQSMGSNCSVTIKNIKVCA